MRKTVLYIIEDIRLWQQGWFHYVVRRLRKFGVWFERNKDFVVDVLVARRGGYQRPFLHFSLSILILTGVLAAPILANTYPFGVGGALADFTPPSAVVTELDFAEFGIATQKSEKPRDQIITYTVQPGDTLSTVGEKFGVSVDSIKWANDIKRDSLIIGQDIKIPPVTGIVHKVREGETVYSIAKKYKSEPQKIVNFPFNDFNDLDTFALNVGQTLVVPDGVIQEAAAPRIARPVPPVVAGGSGQFSWPTNGVITQYPIWYHMALDIASPALPPIAAADDGVIASVQYLKYGYGQHIIVSHGDGYQTLYGHLSQIYVNTGDKVTRGQVIGKMGSTGRSTGPHLHFEVRKNGVIVNPLGFLK